MMIPELDIERLHKIHEGKLSGRGCGRTTWFATQMIGLSELDKYRNKRIAVIAIELKRAKHICDVVCDVCIMMNVEYERISHLSLLINNTYFDFVSDSNEARHGHYYIDSSIDYEY